MVNSQQGKNLKCHTALCADLKSRNIFESAGFKNISVLIKASIGCNTRSRMHYDWNRLPISRCAGGLSRNCLAASSNCFTISALLLDDGGTD